MKKLTIAIDGPAGAGKSTVAQAVAQRLNYIYIDTGAMYRAITWKVMNSNLNYNDKQAIIELAKDAKLRLQYCNGKTRVFVDDIEVTDEIRNPDVSVKVAEIAQIAEIRDILISKQRAMADSGGVVMDGRDICSHVLPNAEIKLFLTASIAERAMRRWTELVNKGLDVKLEDIQTDIACRDKKDCEREVAPLVKADDAILIDTTAMSIDDAVQRILDICKGRTGLV